MKGSFAQIDADRCDVHRSTRKHSREAHFEARQSARFRDPRPAFVVVTSPRSHSERIVGNGEVSFRIARDPGVSETDSQKPTYQGAEIVPVLISTATLMALLQPLGNTSSESKITRPNGLLFRYQLREKIDLYLSQ